MSDDLHAQADRLLETISTLTDRLQDAEARAQAEMDAVRSRHGPAIETLRAAIADGERVLATLMKTHKREFFADTDKVSLPHGWLRYGKEWALKLSKNTKDLLQERGWTEALKVAVSVDRSVLADWPEEKLFAVGAKKTLKEVFGYEVKK